LAIADQSLLLATRIFLGHGTLSGNGSRDGRAGHLMCHPETELSSIAYAAATNGRKIAATITTKVESGRGGNAIPAARNRDEDKAAPIR
jgi:hypothetical protein